MRIPELDALRGIGALAILGSRLWPVPFSVGRAGVDLFFVLSGYLITTLILRHGHRPRFLRAFWARRALRTWPVYFLLLAFLAARAYFAGDPLRRDRLIAHLTFTQNLPHDWSGTAPRPLDGATQTWSLAIEEQFYLLWPLVIFLAGRSLLVPLALWLMVNAVAARWLDLDPGGAFTRWDGLALGALLAAFLGDGARPGRRPAWPSAALAGIGLIALAFLASPAARWEPLRAGKSGGGPLPPFAVNVLAASFIGLVVRHAGHPLLGPLRGRVLGYLGRISYGIFLYHLIIIEIVTESLRPRTVATDLAAVELVLLAAVISWECLERPIGDLKVYFRYETDSAWPLVSPDPAKGEEGRRERDSMVRLQSAAARAAFALLGLGALALGLGLGLSPGPRRGFLDRVYVGPSGEEVKYVLFVPHSYSNDSPCPLILSLHGAGATGTDGRKPSREGLGAAIRRREAAFPFLVVFPQSHDRSWERDSPDARRALAILAEIEATYHVDPRRVYLTGQSMGGNGTWSLAAADPGRWAAIVPVCGWGDRRTATRIKPIPCWCFHGAADHVVPVAGSRDMVAALRTAGGTPRYTEYPGGGHNCWDRAYRTPELYDWLLNQHRRD